MFERPDIGERALLVHLDIGVAGDPEQQEEFRLLAESAGATVAGVERPRTAGGTEMG